MVNRDEIIYISEYRKLKARCYLSRRICNGVRLYIKLPKLQPNEKCTVNYCSISQTQSQIDWKCDWRYMTPKYSTLEHTKYLIWTLHLNWKETYWECSFCGFAPWRNDPFSHYGKMYCTATLGDRICSRWMTNLEWKILWRPGRVPGRCGQSMLRNM